jgi:glycosyltransferase involved in cell wall biosynthesis
LISIIVPAHDEASVLEACLHGLTEGAREDEIEVLVVCNGCTDHTEAVARGFGPPVRVLTTSVASKTRALNLGDEHATGFPRFYVDADVLLDIEAVRRVTECLEQERVLAAAPRAVVRLERASWSVRAFYRVWTRLPYFDASMIGSGVYAVSAAGRTRFERFPEIIADDEYVRRLFARGERVRVDACTFTITPPVRIAGVVREKTRSCLGRYQLALRFPELRRSFGERLGAVVEGLRLLREPSVWPSVPVYLGVVVLARLRALRRALLAEFDVWERDATSRSRDARAGDLRRTQPEKEGVSSP